MNKTNQTKSNQDSFNQVDRAWIFIGLSILGLLIFAANGLVFLLIYKERSLIRKTNYFLISLAFSDILTGLIGIPILIVCNSEIDDTDECFTAMDASNKFLAFSTILHILAATSERYIKVLAPLHYRRLVTRLRVVFILVAIWVVSLSIPLLEFIWGMKNNNISFIYSITILSCLAIFPLVIMVFMTIHIFLLIREQKKRFRTLSNRVTAQKERKRKNAERRASIVYSAMTISFAFCWIPYFTLSLLSEKSDINIPIWFGNLWLFIKFSSGLIDPLLYTFFKTDFQAALRALVRNGPSKYEESSIPMNSLINKPNRNDSDDEQPRKETLTSHA